MKRYRLYGLDLASELPLTHAVPEIPDDEVSGPPDVTLERTERDDPLPGEDDPGAEIVYRSPELRSDGEPVLAVTRARGAVLLRYAGEASFSLPEPPERQAQRVVALPEPPEPIPQRIVARPEAAGEDGAALVELRLLGPVLAFHLERSGTLALHASAVTLGGGAVAFPAGAGGGKSSLAAALLAAGRPLLTDDVLAIGSGGAAGGFVARPSYPQMRFEPEDAERWLGAGRAATLPRAHPGFEKVRVPVGRNGFGRFDPEPRPLTRVYRIDRIERGEIAIEPVSAREAVLALLAGSFLPRLVGAMGWSRWRLDRLGALASAVPVRRIVLPAGLDRLPEAVERIARDASPPG